VTASGFRNGRGQYTTTPLSRTTGRVRFLRVDYSTSTSGRPTPGRPRTRVSRSRKSPRPIRLNEADPDRCQIPGCYRYRSSSDRRTELCRRPGRCTNGHGAGYTASAARQHQILPAPAGKVALIVSRLARTASRTAGARRPVPRPGRPPSRNRSVQHQRKPTGSGPPRRCQTSSRAAEGSARTGPWRLLKRYAVRLDRRAAEHQPGPNEELAPRGPPGNRPLGDRGPDRGGLGRENRAGRRTGLPRARQLPGRRVSGHGAG